jgi:hypothetical protein
MRAAGRAVCQAGGVEDEQIIAQISSLVDEEHRLRERRLAGELDTQEEQARLRAVEIALDQLWDLLRRRRAARDSGTNPDEVEPLAVDRVEGYLQ